MKLKKLGGLLATFVVLMLSLTLINTGSTYARYWSETDVPGPSVGIADLSTSTTAFSNYRTLEIPDLNNMTPENTTWITHPYLEFSNNSPVALDFKLLGAAVYGRKFVLFNSKLTYSIVSDPAECQSVDLPGTALWRVNKGEPLAATDQEFEWVRKNFRAVNEGADVTVSVPPKEIVFICPHIDLNYKDNIQDHLSAGAGRWIQMLTVYEWVDPETNESVSVGTQPAQGPGEGAPCDYPEYGGENPDDKRCEYTATTISAPAMKIQGYCGNKEGRPRYTRVQFTWDPAPWKGGQGALLQEPPIPLHHYELWYKKTGESVFSQVKGQHGVSDYLLRAGEEGILLPTPKWWQVLTDNNYEFSIMRDWFSDQGVDVGEQVQFIFRACMDPDCVTSGWSENTVVMSPNAEDALNRAECIAFPENTDGRIGIAPELWSGLPDEVLFQNVPNVFEGGVTPEP